MAKPESIERVSASELPEASDLPAPELGQVLDPQGRGTGIPKMHLGVISDGADHAILKHYADGAVDGEIYSYTGKTLATFKRPATSKVVPVDAPQVATTPLETAGAGK